MLELRKIRFKNFFSYGNEITELPLENMGICLVRGEIEDNESKKKSNGSGKSTLLNSILWCLAGRTMHHHSPKILNWFNKEDAWTQLEFTNGAVLTREKTRGGDTNVSLELPNQSYDSTLSTTTNEQSRINRELMFDWDLFCGSAFFAQIGQPWLNMSDQSRKQALERILHVDRFSTYSEVAKAKLVLATNDQNICKSKLTDLNRDLNNSLRDANEARESRDSWVDGSEKQKDIYLNQAKQYQDARDKIKLVDMQELQAKWDKIAQIESKIRQLKSSKSYYHDTLSETNSEIEAKKRFIANWESKSGKVCDKCNQDITCEHVDTQIGDHRTKLAELEAVAKATQEKIKATNAAVSQIEAKLESAKPTKTISDAKRDVEEWQKQDRLHKKALKDREAVEPEENPYVKQCIKLEARIAECRERIEEYNKDISEADILINHYSYISKSYSDRKKVKSFVIADYLPYFNSRLEYYLDAFELDVKLKLTESLAIESTHWDFTYESGGEKMRSNVAFTFAVYDLHESLYGKQSNILVLDEVDGALDSHGVNCLIELIRNDLSKKVGSIFIISHKQDMHNVFPREILIHRDANRMSSIKEIR